MPELPDILLYLHALRPRIVGRAVERVRLASAFLLRSIDPPLSAVEGRMIVDLHRLGKRIVDGSRRRAVPRLPPDDRRPIPLEAAWHEDARQGRVCWRSTFRHGTLLLTEAGTKRQASLHVVQGRDGARAARSGRPRGPGCRRWTRFRSALARENHTLKRALTDPHLFSGIGNAYSDEILHAARLSPFKQTRRSGTTRRVGCTRPRVSTLLQWTSRLQEETGDEFPEKVTAFREGMAVHGRYGQPCPVCGCAGAARRLRRQRSQLLRHLPDRRPAARRSLAVAAAARGLAANARGARAPPAKLICLVAGQTRYGASPGSDPSQGTRVAVLAVAR